MPIKVNRCFISGRSRSDKIFWEKIYGQVPPGTIEILF